ncbi:MAG: hypothetical protein HYX90_10510 [Chloroflexi bacterium]|nr:hypothetical protein [Chloroflexota bacterium]
MVEFPIDMFFAGSDLSPLDKQIDKVIQALTMWRPSVKGAEKSAATVTVEGRDQYEAILNMNLMFLKNDWGDGLPLLPATRERVELILAGTDLDRHTIIGKILPRGGTATVEQIAIALAMTGGRSEYLPVLIAAVDAMVDPASQHAHMATTTCSNYPVLIVNGPIAREIRLNSGYGCLGPDPRHPAGASIGRALRLLQMNVGGAIPGSGTMALFGGANRYTNIVFAEDESGLPEGWEPLNVERGFPRGSNVVTVHFANATINMIHAETTTEPDARHALNIWARFIGTPNGNYFIKPDRWENGSPGILLMARGSAQGLAKHGWTKEKIRDFLWTESTLPPSVVESCGLDKSMKRMGLDPTKPLTVSKTPKSIIVVVAGGEQSEHAYFMPNQGYTPMSRPIELPGKAKWESLMRRAEEELGPIPER